MHLCWETPSENTGLDILKNVYSAFKKQCNSNPVQSNISDSILKTIVYLNEEPRQIDRIKNSLNIRFRGETTIDHQFSGNAEVGAPGGHGGSQPRNAPKHQMTHQP